MADTPDEHTDEATEGTTGAGSGAADTSATPDLGRPTTSGDTVKSTEAASGDATDAEVKAGETGAAAPATAAAAAPPAPPKGPHDPVVAAHHDPLAVAIAKTRKRPPFWAAIALVILPVWGLLYLNTMTKPAANANDPITIGGTLYATNCSSCHGATGGGGVGPALAGGAVMKDFPSYKDHIQWVTLGADGFRKAGKTTVGANKLALGASGGMPGFGGTLTDQQIAQIVLFERVQFGNESPGADLTALTALATTGTGG